MERPTVMLAGIPNFGQIYRCGDCSNIHVQVGPVSVSFTVDAYFDFVALVNTSASNFEMPRVMLETDPSDAGESN